MKILSILSLLIIFVVCSCRDAGTPVSGNQLAHYIHLAVGDSLGYNFPGDTETRFYTVITGVSQLGGRTYFKVQSYLLAGAAPFDLFMREDQRGNVYVILISPYGEQLGSRETILYKTGANIGSSWSVNYFGKTLTCEMESRTESITTSSGTFVNCLKIKISWAGDWEYHWLAPDVGLAKREFYTITARPIFMPDLELTELKLKN